MKTIGAYEAKTHLSSLLHEVESRHEAIAIRRHNRNVAWLVPYDSYQAGGAVAVDYLGGLDAIRASVRGKVNIIAYRDEGRKR